MGESSCHLEPERAEAYFMSGNNHKRKYEVWCPYCGQQCRCGHQSEIHPSRKAGRIYICEDCQAYVGCHGDTKKPLGSPANKELRSWRRIAHLVFDPLWKDSPYVSRRQTYSWLAHNLGMKERDCHIAMFDINDCKRLVKLIHPMMEKWL